MGWENSGSDDDSNCEDKKKKHLVQDVISICSVFGIFFSNFLIELNFEQNVFNFSLCTCTVFRCRSWAACYEWTQVLWEIFKETYSVQSVVVISFLFGTQHAYIVCSDLTSIAVRYFLIYF
jgi:hypothetical protein